MLAYTHNSPTTHLQRVHQRYTIVTHIHKRILVLNAPSHLSAAIRQRNGITRYTRTEFKMSFGARAFMCVCAHAKRATRATLPITRNATTKKTHTSAPAAVIDEHQHQRFHLSRGACSVRCVCVFSAQLESLGARTRALISLKVTFARLL